MEDERPRRHGSKGAEYFDEARSERQAATMATIHEGGDLRAEESQPKSAESSSKQSTRELSLGDWRGKLLSRLPR
jgi:hypothetical protein